MTDGVWENHLHVYHLSGSGRASDAVARVHSYVSHLPVTGFAPEGCVAGGAWRNHVYVNHLPATGWGHEDVCSRGVPFGSCSLVGSSWRRHLGGCWGDRWDPTLGYPGEGPEGGTRILPIGTANITAWSSLLGSEILGKGVGGTFPGVWALQEHKLVGRGLKKARRHLDGAGWGSAFEPALVTAKLGRSSGAAVIWERSMVGEADVAAYTSAGCGRHRL